MVTLSLRGGTVDLSSGAMGASFPAGLPSGPDLEFRLPAAYRRPVLMRFILNSVLTLIMAASALGASGALHTLVLLVGSVSGAIAVCCGAAYLWRGRFCTRITGRGIESHGYFNQARLLQELGRQYASITATQA